MYGTRIILLSAAVVVVLPRTTTTTMSDMMDDASLQILVGVAFPPPPPSCAYADNGNYTSARHGTRFFGDVSHNNHASMHEKGKEI